MALWLVVLIAVVLWFAASPRRTETASPGTPRVRRGVAPGWWLLAGLAAVLLVRFGLHWVAVAGGAALALARGVAPLLRLLPFFMQARAMRDGGRAAPGGIPPGSGENRDSAGRARMSREEALQVLGLTPSATPEDVRREYRRLMKKLHPDLGGSSYLAAKINEARDILS